VSITFETEEPQPVIKRTGTLRVWVDCWGERDATPADLAAAGYVKLPVMHDDGKSCVWHPEWAKAQAEADRLCARLRQAEAGRDAVCDDLHAAESESASLRARLAEAEAERADCVRAKDVAEALGMLNDIDAGREIIEAAQSVKRSADRLGDDVAFLYQRLAEAEAERDHWRTTHAEVMVPDNTVRRARDALLVVEASLRSDLAQAREELAALREVAEAARNWGTCVRVYELQGTNDNNHALSRAAYALRVLIGPAACPPHWLGSSKLSALPSEGKACSDCEGSGHTSVECHVCCGTGKQYEPEQESAACGPDELRAYVDKCHGSGRTAPNPPAAPSLSQEQVRGGTSDYERGRWAMCGIVRSVLAASGELPVSGVWSGDGDALASGGGGECGKCGGAGTTDMRHRDESKCEACSGTGRAGNERAP
jgi:hypothetical protein